MNGSPQHSCGGTITVNPLRSRIATASRPRSGSKPFTAQGPVRTVYFFVLITHIILAALVPPMALITLIRGLRARYDRHARLAADAPLSLGDRITLGEVGPDLRVEAIQLPGQERQEIHRQLRELDAAADRVRLVQGGSRNREGAHHQRPLLELREEGAAE